MKYAFGLTGLVVSACAALSGCGKGDTAKQPDNPVALIKAGDAKACAHPEVIKALTALITNPKGDEELVVPLDAAAIAKLNLPAVTVDRITLASVDSSVHRLACRGTSLMVADIGGPSQRFEKEVNYVLSPSAQDEKAFVVTSDASVASDRINIALVKQMASGLRQAEQDEATKARLQSALENAGAVGAITPASNVAEPAATSVNAEDQPSYSAEYQRCMDSGDAANGVTVAMVDCASAELTKQDGRLNRAYGAAMANRDAAQKVTLRNAQRAWIKLRDTKCREDLEGGTMDQIVETDCHLEMTAKRANELERMARP